MDYSKLVTAWTGATQPPAGVDGTGLRSDMTTEQKLAAVNAWRVAGNRQALLTPSQILNAIVPTDLASLTQIQVSQLALLLSGATVDASAGTTIRLAAQNLFAGKTQTLQNLLALVQPFDNAWTNWCGANGYPVRADGTGNLTLSDCANAGVA